MSKLIIYHGSENIIEKPYYHGGKKENDYGYGFYCTENIELAKEWACSNNETNGFACSGLSDQTRRGAAHRRGNVVQAHAVPASGNADEAAPSDFRARQRHCPAGTDAAHQTGSAGDHRGTLSEREGRRAGTFRSGRHKTLHQYFRDLGTIPEDHRSGAVPDLSTALEKCGRHGNGRSDPGTDAGKRA